MQRLGQQGDLLRVHGDLAGLGAEHEALHADDVADVEALEGLVGLLAHVVAADVDLNAALAIQQVREAGLAHHAAGHHAACDGDGLFNVVGEVAHDLRGVIGDVGGDGVGVLALHLQGLQLLQADAVLLGQLLLGDLRGVVDFFSHLNAPLKRPACGNTCRSDRR